MNEVYFKIKGYTYLEDAFPDKDIISIDELMGKFETLMWDVETLEEELRERRNADNE